MSRYDDWKTETDLDESNRLGKLYPVACMIEGCPTIVGESTIEGSTGLCERHLAERYPDIGEGEQ